MCKKAYLFLLLLPLFMLFVFCDNDETGQNYTCVDVVSQFENTLPITATFWAVNLTTYPYRYYIITATKWDEGVNCAVYVEIAPSDQRSRMSSFSEPPVTVFDDTIYSKVTGNFAPAPDMDNNNKVVLLYNDILDGFGPFSNSFVGGYFYFYNEYSYCQAGNNNTNQCDMLYIDTWPGAKDDYYRELVKLTVAHEFQHMCNFNVKHFVQGHTETMDTWMDEGLAENAAHFTFSLELTSRVDYVNQDKDDVFKDGEVSLVHWNSIDNSIVLGNYSLSYLFFNYLWSQTGSPTDCSIFNQLIYNNHNDVEALKEVINANLSGKSLEDAYRDFLIALYLNNNYTTSGVYSFNGFVDTPVTPPTGTHSSMELKPYAFAFLRYDYGIDEITPTSDADIEFIGINGSFDVDLTVPYNIAGTNGYLIAWNKSSNWSSGNYPMQGFSTATSSIAKSCVTKDTNDDSGSKPSLIYVNPYELVRGIHNNN